MIVRRATGRLIRMALLAGFGFLFAGSATAETAVSLSAHYTITMTHVRVGEIAWAVNFTDKSYLAAANGKASGVFSVLVKGEGALTTHGAYDGKQLTPLTVRTDISDDDGVYETEMTLQDGALKHLEDRGAAAPSDRIPVGPDYLKAISDPLSALLIPVEGNAMAPANCGKVLRIFDGRRRYNLALSFLRIDTVKMARGYAGRVLVCGVVLRPIAGYRPDSLVVRYLAGKTDLELWFAPVAGAPIMAPIRALMPTLIGTMDIQANEFVATKTETAPRPAPPAPVQTAPLPPPAQAPVPPAPPAQAPPKEEPLTTKP